MNKDNEESVRTQERHSAQLEKRCYEYLSGLLGALDSCLDRRLVETFLALVMVVIMHRHRNNGLLLSELGGYLKSPDQAPAGTKRISRLLHSPKWGAEMIETYLWTQADARVESLEAEGKQVLVVWDERSTFLSPSMIRCNILPNSRNPFDRLRASPQGQTVHEWGYEYSNAARRFVYSWSYSWMVLFTASAHSLGRDERSTFLSPSMIRCNTLPNCCNSCGALESAAIFCAALKYPSASGRFSLAD
jgi:hypothetical protein